MKYTKELLDTILNDGEATLVGEYERFNQRMRVKFRCKCGVETDKKFEMLNLYRSPYCVECSKKAMKVKQIATCLERFGVENAGANEEKKKKIKESWQKKYGGHPKQNKEVQEKWKQTCFVKYGGHPNQNADVQAKAEANSYKYRDYILPSGKIVKVQGYEDKALDELLEHFVEEEIVIGRAYVPRIPYVCKEGKKRIYFPDFYIPSTNTILEIKSEWTVKLKSSRLEERAKAVVEKGYRFEVWVYDGLKKNKQILTF